MTNPSHVTEARHVDGADVQEGDVVLHDGRRVFIDSITDHTGPISEPGWRVAWVGDQPWATLVPGESYVILGRVNP